MKGTVSVISNDAQYKETAIPIYNGTLKIFNLINIMRKILYFFYIQSIENSNNYKKFSCVEIRNYYFNGIKIINILIYIYFQSH